MAYLQKEFVQMQKKNKNILKGLKVRWTKFVTYLLFYYKQLHVYRATIKPI